MSQDREQKEQRQNIRSARDRSLVVSHLHCLASFSLSLSLSLYIFATLSSRFLASSCWTCNCLVDTPRRSELGRNYVFRRILFPKACSGLSGSSCNGGRGRKEPF